MSLAYLCLSKRMPPCAVITSGCIYIFFLTISDFKKEISAVARCYHQRLSHVTAELKFRFILLNLVYENSVPHSLAPILYGNHL